MEKMMIEKEIIIELLVDKIITECSELLDEIKSKPMLGECKPPVRKPMSEEKATKIMTDLLDILGIIYSIQGFCYLSECIMDPKKGMEFRKYEITTPLSIEECKKCSVILRNFEEKGNLSTRILTLFANNEEFIDTNIIEASFKDRIFEIQICNSPDDFGFDSLLPDYDPESYQAVEILELRPDGSKKYDMTFGFDIENMQFLELLDLIHENQIGIIRMPNAECFDELQKKFYGKKIRQLKRI